jgi:hypothetical protein
MYHRGCFREDIFDTYILCKKENNDIKHVINECFELKDKLINELNKLDKKLKN